jgi:hypothetical protein
MCTTRSQSEALLKLGLKKETADMVLLKEMAYDENNHCTRDGDNYLIRPIDYIEGEEHRGHIPAWSLHRLCDMMPKNIAIDGDTAYPLQIQKRSDGKWCVGYQGWYDCVGDLYDSVIWIYQLLISEGYLDEFCNKG